MELVPECLRRLDDLRSAFDDQALADIVLKHVVADGRSCGVGLTPVNGSRAFVGLCVASSVLRTYLMPILEDHKGPLCVMVGVDPDHCARLQDLTLRAAEPLQLSVRNLCSALVPAMPPHRRAEIVIGTPADLLSAFRQKQYGADSVAFVCVATAVERLDRPQVMGELRQHHLKNPRIACLFGTSSTDDHQHAPFGSFAPLTASVQGTMSRPRKMARSEECGSTVSVLVGNVVDGAGDTADWDQWADELVAGCDGHASFCHWVHGAKTAISHGADAGMYDAPSRACCVLHCANAEAAALTTRMLWGKVFAGHSLCASATSSCEPSFDILPRVLLIRNAVSAPRSLTAASNRRGIVDALKESFAAFGQIVKTDVWVAGDFVDACLDTEAVQYRDTARVFFEFSSFAAAAAAGEAHHGRTFDGRVLHVSLFDAERFRSSRLAPEVGGEAKIDAIELVI